MTQKTGDNGKLVNRESHSKRAANRNKTQVTNMRIDTKIVAGVGGTNYENPNTTALHWQQQRAAANARRGSTVTGNQYDKSRRPWHVCQRTE